MAGNSANIGKLIVDLLLKDDQFKLAMGGAAKSTGAAMPKIQQVASRAMGAVTTAFKVAAGAMVAFGTASAVVGAGFEQQMSAVAAVRGITDKTSDAFTALEDKARELGATTAFSATEAAQGMEALARAGLSTTEIIAASETALKLAGAGQIELGRSAEIIAASMAQFGLAADDASMVADVFTAATQNSLFATEDLAQAMKYAGPVGAAFGKDIVEVTAAVAQFRDLGMEGTMAGTQFRMAMAAAAKPTAQAEAALKKYGLTAADVNPEMHSFREIMLAVGEAGVTATDSLTIFGTRAGGAVATVAGKMAESTDSFDSLTQKLQDSAGTTATTYETMMDNVMGGLAKLRSVTEELFLTLFDQFAGPLQGLIESLSVVVGAVVEAVAAQGGALGDVFTDTMGGIAAFLTDNADDLADAFVNTMAVLASLAPALQGIAQVLVVMARNADLLAVSMLGFLMVGLAVKFAIAINGLALAFGTASTAVTIFGTTMTVTTGGLFAIVAAVGAAVAAFAVLISRMASARDHTDQLREAQEALEQRTGDLATAEEERLGAVLDAQQVRLRARLATEKEMDPAIRRRIESVLSLTAAEARAGLATGKLVEMNGDLVDTQALVADMGEDAADVILTMASAAEAEAAAVQSQLDATAPLLKFYEDTTSEREKEFQLRRAAIALGLDESASLAQVEVRLKELQGARREEAGKAKALRDKVAKGTADALQSETAAELDAVQLIAQARAEGADAAEDSAARTVAAQEAVRDATEDTLAQLRTEVAQLGLEGADAEAFLFAQRRDELRKLYADQLAAEEATGDRRKALEEELQEALRLLGIVETRKRTDAQAEAEEKAASDAAQSRADAEIAASDLLYRLRWKGLTRLGALEAEKALALEELAGASAETQAEVAAAFDKKMLQAPRTFGEHVSESAAAMRRAVGSAADLGKQLGAVVDKGGKVGAALRGVRDKLQGVAQDVQGSVGGALDKLRDKLTPDNPTKFQKAVGAVGKAMGEGLVRIGAGAADTVGRVGRMLRDAVGPAAAFGAALVKAGKQGAEALGNLLETLTGFSFNLQDVIGDALSAQADAVGAQAEATDAIAAAQEALAAAEASGDTEGTAAAQAELAEAEAALAAAEASLGGGVQGFATDAVLELVSGASEFLQALVDGAPAALQALAASLPTLLNEVVAAIPLLVDALVTNIPPIIDAIVNALPALLDALISGLVQVVVAVLEQLPGLITQLLTVVLPALLQTLAEQIPILLQALVDAIPLVLEAIIAALPVLLIAVIDLIPVVLQALVDSVPTIITALLVAVPQLVGAVVGQIPYLITTLISALPDIMDSLIEQLPDLLSAVIAMIPLVTIEIIAALPEIAIALVVGIVTTLIPQLPRIVWELFKAIIAGMADALKKIAEGIWNAIKGFFNIFKKNKNKKGSYSGMEYVPATMRMTVHKGEAIVPADRNAEAASGSLGPAPAGAAQNFGPQGMGGSAPIEIAVIAEGRLLDAVQITAARRGHATGMVKAIRRAAGVKVGFTRGRFSAWTG